MGLSGKDSIFMGNIDEKRISALLERIVKIKVELEALEHEARSLATETESRPPVTEPVEVAEPVATEQTASTEVQADDTPIDIDFQDIDITPIIEDPAAEYTAASTDKGADDIPVTEPTAPVAEPDSPVTEPDSPVTEPVEVTTNLSPEHAETNTPAGAAMVTEPVEVTMEINEPAKTAALDDLPFDDDLPENNPSAITEPTQEPMLNIEPETVIKPATEHEPTPKAKAAILDSRKAENAVMDVMAEKQAWRTDRPGSQVKNVISAISLNDRVLLINVLFREDPLLFQNTISAFNGMTTLDEALTYIQTNFPDWDLNSEPVYRLMMAVRRKLK